MGVVVQAYQKRAPGVIAALRDLAQRSGRRIMVRLVKGAYWDSEIKRAQVAGTPDYPVFTTKAATDLSYIVCASRSTSFSEITSLSASSASIAKLRSCLAAMSANALTRG